MTSPTFLRRQCWARQWLLLVSPDPDAPSEVTASDECLSHLKTDPQRQTITVNTGVCRGELT
jgi:hypothetical protein